MSYDYDAAVADWPPLSDEQKDRIAALLRPSGKGLQRIDSDDVAEVLDAVKEIGGAA